MSRSEAVIALSVTSRARRGLEIEKSASIEVGGNVTHLADSMVHRRTLPLSQLRQLLNHGIGLVTNVQGNPIEVDTIRDVVAIPVPPVPVHAIETKAHI